LIGYFEGIDSERGIAWRAADSFALRDFLGVGLDSAPPDHSTMSRTRRLIALEAHRAVFTWVLQGRLAALIALLILRPCTIRAAVIHRLQPGCDVGDSTAAMLLHCRLLKTGTCTTGC
jgi:hypothetical protein